MKYLILIALSATLMSCTKEDAKKKLAKVLTANISETIIENLECSNSDAVKLDVGAKVDEMLKIEAQSSSIASQICGSMVELIVPQLIQSGLPAAWECSAEGATGNAIELAKKGCEKL